VLDKIIGAFWVIVGILALGALVISAVVNVILLLNQ